MTTTPSPGNTTTPPTTAAHMNEEQAELLATLVHTLRPDWGTQGILKHLGLLHATMDATTLTLGTLHAASDPTNRTPAILMHPGKHWDKARGLAAPAKQTEPQRSQGIDTSPMCPNHPERHEWECKTCSKPAPRPANFRQMVADAAAQFSQSINEALDQADSSEQ